MTEPTLYRIDLSPTYGKTPETQRPIYKQADVDEWIVDGVLVPVKSAYYQNSDGVDPEDVLIRYLVERGVDKDNAYGIAHHLVHSVLYSVTKAVDSAGIGGKEIQHEEWCNVFKNQGTCSCTGIGDTDE